MQTLGIGTAPEPSDNRLKALFWPSVNNATDVDALGTQGFWLSLVVAILSFVMLIITGHFVMAPVIFLYYGLGAVGIRERSLYAAIVVFAMYALDTFFMPFSVVRILLTVLLFSNARATFIAKHWKSDSEEAVMPPRLGDTFTDKLSDKMPQWLWPKAKYFYYPFSVCFIALVGIGLATRAAQIAAR
jgi:hypothetical protein